MSITRVTLSIVSSTE